MTEIMPVPRNLILLSYQQGAFAVLFFEGDALRFVPCRPQGGCDTRSVRRVFSDAHVVRKND